MILRLISIEGSDKLLTNVTSGVGMMWREMAKITTPHQEWSIEGEKIKCVTSSPLKSHTMECELGKEFDDKRLDDEIVKVW